MLLKFGNDIIEAILGALRINIDINVNIKVFGGYLIVRGLDIIQNFLNRLQALVLRSRKIVKNFGNLLCIRLRGIRNHTRKISLLEIKRPAIIGNRVRILRRCRRIWGIRNTLGLGNFRKSVVKTKDRDRLALVVLVILKKSFIISRDRKSIEQFKRFRASINAIVTLIARRIHYHLAYINRTAWVWLIGQGQKLLLIVRAKYKMNPNTQKRAGTRVRTSRISIRNI